MLAIFVHEPSHPILLAFRPAATAACELDAWWRVHSQAEEIRRLGEIGEHFSVGQEVNEYNDVGEENSKQDEEERFLIVGRTAGCVLLRSDRGVEILILAGCEDSCCPRVILFVSA